MKTLHAVVALAITLHSSSPVWSAEQISVAEFTKKKSAVLKRLEDASAHVDYLDPVWRTIVPRAALWLEKKLGGEFTEIDVWASNVLDYANKLADGLEGKENFLAKVPGARIPLWIQSQLSSNKLVEYSISFPTGFPSQKKAFPLSFAFPGRGNMTMKISYQSTPEVSPFIVVRPVSQEMYGVAALNVLFKELKGFLPIDADKVYCRGGSMGGYITLAWAMSNPEHFAAISVMSSGGDIFRASRLRNVPIWMFHGEKDRICEAEKFLTALQDCGANVKFTFFPEGGHNIGPLIDFKALDDWMLHQTRSREPVPRDPVLDLQLDENGIGAKTIVEIPPQRFAVVRAKKGEEDKFNEQLYDVYRKAGLRARGNLETQTLPSLPEESINVRLAVPKEIRIGSVQEPIQIVETKRCRALTFAVFGRDDDAPMKAAKDALQELERAGKRPTGEIGITSLAADFVRLGDISRISLPLED